MVGFDEERRVVVKGLKRNGKWRFEYEEPTRDLDILRWIDRP
jgi:hypothetical protein